MVTQIAAPITFQYSHTIGRQELRGGNGFFNPVSITRGHDGRMYVVSRGTDSAALTPCRRVTIFNVDEEYLGQFGRKTGPDESYDDAPDGTFVWPTGIAIDSQGNAYVADEWANRISIFDPNGEFVAKWGALGDGDGQFNKPSGLAMDRDDNLYVVDSVNHRIQRFTKDGKFLAKWGSFGSDDGQFNLPWGIEIDPAGDVYVADWRNDRIQKFTPNGAFLMKFGSSGSGDGEFDRPTSVAVDKDGTIYVTDFRNDRLQVFDPDGAFITKLHGEATLSQWGRERVQIDPSMVLGRQLARDLEEREKPFQGPVGVEVDDQGRIYVAEVARHRVQVFHKQPTLFMGGAL